MVAETYTYDSYGKPTSSTGTFTNPFQYTGREFDPKPVSTTIERAILIRARGDSSARIVFVLREGPTSIAMPKIILCAGLIPAATDKLVGQQRRMG